MDPNESSIWESIYPKCQGCFLNAKWESFNVPDVIEKYPPRPDEMVGFEVDPAPFKWYTVPMCNYCRRVDEHVRISEPGVGHLDRHLP